MIMLSLSLPQILGVWEYNTKDWAEAQYILVLGFFFKIYAHFEFWIYISKHLNYKSNSLSCLSVKLFNSS